MNTVHVAMQGTKVVLVAQPAGRATVTKTFQLATAALAQACVANLVKGAEAQKASVTVTVH